MVKLQDGTGIALGVTDLLYDLMRRITEVIRAIMVMGVFWVVSYVTKTSVFFLLGQIYLISWVIMMVMEVIGYPKITWIQFGRH